MDEKFPVITHDTSILQKIRRNLQKYTKFTHTDKHTKGNKNNPIVHLTNFRMQLKLQSYR